MTTRRSSLRPAGAIAIVIATAVSCANDAGVRTEQADVIGDRSPSVQSSEPGSPASEPPPESSADEPDDDDGPLFTLPDLTLPERPPPTAGDSADNRDTAPPDDATADAASADDLASAGDSLYPDLGNDGIDVEHYWVSIGYDPAAPVINGEVTLSLRALRDVDQVVLDAVDLDVLDVQLALGEPVAFGTTDDELIIDLPLRRGAEVDVTVVYVADPSASSVGDVGWFATSNGAYVLNEPDGVRRWMPADDHPGDKATWRFELTVPDHLAGIANGDHSSTLDTGLATTWIWTQRDPMATYLVQVLIGDYVVLDGGTVGSTPIVNVALRDDVEQMQPYFDTVAPQLEFFESVFGPYPLDRYGLAFTESESGLAMETQGRSMFSADDFPGTVGDLEQLLLSHELAHQWFGDAVTLADWGDLWLNESFATYGQWLWFDHAGTSSIDESAAIALEARRVPGEPTGTPTVDNLFGLERYDGGAVVLHALRLELGDDAFFDLLARWVADNDGESRTTEDFIALAEEIADRPLTDFFDRWLFSATVPATYPD